MGSGPSGRRESFLQAASRSLLCHHDEIVPYEALLHRRAEGEARGAKGEERRARSEGRGAKGEESGQKIALRSPNATDLKTALHRRLLDTSEATDEVNGPIKNQARFLPCLTLFLDESRFI